MVEKLKIIKGGRVCLPLSNVKVHTRPVAERYFILSDQNIYHVRIIDFSLSPIIEVLCDQIIIINF